MGLFLPMLTSEEHYLSGLDSVFITFMHGMIRILAHARTKKIISCGTKSQELENEENVSRLSKQVLQRWEKFLRTLKSTKRKIIQQKSEALRKRAYHRVKCCWTA